VAVLFRAAFGTLTFLPTLHTPDEDRAYFRRVIAERDVWVYEESTAILGFVALTELVLTDLYVEPDAQRQGIGTALLEHAKAQRPAGFDLWVFQRNEGARRFYERHGCRLAELTDGSENEEREPDARYEWAPSGAGSSRS
jgi:ribosomal protein S18 acetylase RimI-like enzyme